MKEEPFGVGGRKPVPAVRPPYLFGLALFMGLLLHWIRPLDVLVSRPAGAILGLVLLTGGVLLLTWAVRTFARLGISPRFKPVGSIMASGPFAFTRNPMYISFTFIYLGTAFVVSALWPILLLPLVLVVLHYGVIVREEKYLEERFGDEYRKYKGKVRRWF